jgi:hypothetical protein
MKKLIIALSIIALVVCAGIPTESLAASSISVGGYSLQGDGNQLVIKLDCIAHTDGTFTSYEIPETNPAVPYQAQGYYLYEVWSVNDATTYPTIAAAVTLTSAQGMQVLKTGEMSLSTLASGISEASLAKFRSVNSKLTIAIGDTGTAANILTIYIKLAR